MFTLESPSVTLSPDVDVGKLGAATVFKVVDELVITGDLLTHAVHVVDGLSDRVVRSNLLVSALP